MALPTNYVDGDTIHATDINNITTAVNASYTPTGTDVAVADGGTGASDASTARTNLGVAYGTGVGTVCQGNDTRLADTRTPTDNTVTSAKIVDGAIVDADVNASAGIVATKLAAAVQTSLGKADTSLQSGGALGTPASGTLTSCTGLPVAGIAASTATALGVGSIELGHATDTTLSRSAAGVLAVEGATVMTFGSGTTTSSATPTIATGTSFEYLYTLSAQAVDITSFTTNLTGTPVTGAKLWIAVIGTAARAITWGTSFVAGAVPLPTTTVTTLRLDVGFVYDGSKWRCMASGSG